MNREDKIGLTLAYIGIIILTIVYSQGVSAETYRQGDIIDLKQSCIFNGAYCDNNYLCNITSTYPNGSILINNQLMTYQTSYYNYTLNPNFQLSLGEYQWRMMCTNGVYNGTNDYSFTITYTGTNPTITQGIIYLILLIICLFITIGLIIAAVKTPFNNITNEFNAVVSVNGLKYLKIGLIVMVYVAMVVLSYLSYSMSKALLDIDPLSQLFLAIYQGLLVAFTPMFVIGIAVGIVMGVRDAKMSKWIKRGVPAR